MENADRKKRIDELGELFLQPLNDAQFEAVLKERGRLIQQEADEMGLSAFDDDGGCTGAFDCWCSKDY